jgi:galactokinase
MADGVDHRRDVSELEARFGEVFGSGEGVRAFRSPGRVNLIGDHIDYSGGLVLPMAIDRGTLLLVRPNAESMLRGLSLDRLADGVVQTPLDDLSHRPELGWFAYVTGVLQAMSELGHWQEQGLDLLVSGNIPDGAGLSSSASLELAVAVAANTIGGGGLTGVELALVSQRVENDYIGVACGIMDQLAVALGRRDHAMLMDCQHAAVDYLAFPHDRASVIIANSNKRRSLNESAYNERRRAVEGAGLLLRPLLNGRRLIDLDPAELDEVREMLDDDVFARVRHTVTEQNRVIAASESLRRGDLLEFGALMRASHESLRDDFEVTGTELDSLAAAAWRQPGTIGARMTGAGFGGCVVILTTPGQEESVIDATAAGYQADTGLSADFFLVGSDDGAHEVTG